MEDRLAEEIVTAVGEAVGDQIDRVVGERTWLYSLWRFSLYAVPFGFSLYLLNGVYHWI